MSVDKESLLAPKLLAMKQIPVQSAGRILRALGFSKRRAKDRDGVSRSMESPISRRHSIRSGPIVWSLFTLGLVGLTFLFTYMIVSHNYSLKMKGMKDRLSLNIYGRAAKIARLERELGEYREQISALSRKGKRRSLGFFTVTAYDPIESCKPFDDGMTSKLIPAGMGVAAVDPGVIPYGAVFYIPEIDKYFFASDTGAAMKRGNGRNIDILMPTVKDALEFGRRRLRVELIDLSKG